MTKAKRTGKIVDMVQKRDDVVFCCDLDAGLVEAVKTQRKRDGLKWRDIIEASFARYLHESGVSDPRGKRSA